MKRNIIRFLAMGLPILPALLTSILDPYNSNIGTLATICIVCGVIALIGVEVHYAQKKYKSREHIMYVGKNTAKLYQRSKISAEQIYFKQVSKTYTQYNPSQTVYTGATVGGIHTGGFHTTQAYYSEKAQGLSGKCMAYMKDVDDKEYTIKKIVLPDDLLQQAKSDPLIGKFVKENYIYLEHETPDTKLTKAEYDILRKATNSNDYATQQNITERAFLASLLTKAECEEIKKWLCGIR